MDFSEENVRRIIADLEKGELSEKEIEDIYTAAKEELKKRENNLIDESSWQNTKSELLDSLGKALNPNDRDSWGAVIEHIKNRLSANDGKLMKLLVYERLLRPILPGIIFGATIAYFILLMLLSPLLRLIGFIQN